MSQEDDDISTTMDIDTEEFATLYQSRTRSRRASLTVMTGPQQGTVIRLEEGSVVLGRDESSDFMVHDVGVSRRHAKVTRSDAQVFLEDLGSSNGTFLEGAQVRATIALRDGDKISLGRDTILRFDWQDAYDEAFQRDLIEAAQRDALTGLYNKRVFLERLGVELSFAQRHEGALSLVLFDIDFFKRINDEHGHLAGDRVLKKLGDRILRDVRREDLAARYGGEEFALLLRQTEEATAVEIAERLRRTIEQEPFVRRGVEIAVTVSLGVATFPTIRAETAEQLIEASDEALYRAKASGRNRVEVARDL